MKKLLLLFSLIACFSAYAQGVGTLKGVVVNEKGEPMPYATASVEGTSKGTLTINDGTFELTDVKFPAVINFSFMGYEPQKASYNRATNNIKITLVDATLSMDEVVVVGYGTLKRSEMTSSVSSINAKDIEGGAFSSFEQILQGRVAGISVVEDSGEPGGGVSISIRGANSLTGSGEPLYVIDGIPINVGDTSDNTVGEDSSRDNPMSFLNPNDILNIEVLKDAAATSIYGARGSNGVIVVTTKQATQGALKVDFSAKFSVQVPSDPFNLVDSKSYSTLKNERVLITTPSLIGDYESWYNSSGFYKGDQNSSTPHPDNAIFSTDFMGEILHTAVMQNYQVNLSAGQQNGNSQMLSFGYTNQEGTIINSGMERFNLKTILRQRLHKRVLLTTNMSLNHTTVDKMTMSGTSVDYGVLVAAVNASPALGLYDTSFMTELDEEGSFQRNPYLEAMNITNQTKTQDFIGSVNFKVDVAKGLTFNSRTGGSIRNSDKTIFYPYDTIQGYNSDGIGQYIANTNSNLSAENYFSYVKTLNKVHSLNLVAGVAYENAMIYQKVNLKMTEFIVDDFGTDNFGLASSTTYVTSNKENSTLQSGYMRFNYAYDKRYLLNFTMRADGSSRFGDNNKWGYFPSASAAWQIAEEDFMKSVEWLNTAKLRVSYGIVGNQSIPNYTSSYTYSTGEIVFNNQSTIYANPTRLNDENLKWESTRSLNGGLDLAFFGNKVSISVDGYYKYTDDLLMNFSLAPSSGYSTYMTNIGAISNRGFEVEAMAYIMDKKNFKWDARFNVSRNVSRVESLGDGATRMDTDGIVNAGGMAEQSHIVLVGQELGLFYGYHTLGLVQYDDFEVYTDNEKTIKTVDGKAVFTAMGDAVVGRVKYDDVNGDGVFSDDDKSVIGKATPDFEFGFTNNFTINKSWSISMFIKGAVGFQVMNATRNLISNGRSTTNQSQKYFDNRWTPDNQHNNAWYPSYSGTSNDIVIADHLIEDGDYIKLKNLTVRYAIPAKFINKLGLKMASVYVTGTNLLTLTKYSGSDPEVNSRPTILTPGIDYASYPQPQIYTMGANITF